MNANYIKGRNSEYAVRNTLTGLGYIVTRAAASIGVFDLVALGVDGRHTHNIAIQVKAGKVRPSPSQYASAINADLLPSTLKLVLYFPDGGAAGRILYSSVQPIPAWCAQVRWLEWMPPRQMKFRGLN